MVSGIDVSAGVEGEPAARRNLGLEPNKVWVAAEYGPVSFVLCTRRDGAGH